MNAFERLEAIAQALRLKWPDGDFPYQMVTRLLEESGELATEVNIFEGSRAKPSKRGIPSKAALDTEARDVIVCALTLVAYYEAVGELHASIADRYERLIREPGVS